MPGNRKNDSAFDRPASGGSAQAHAPRTSPSPPYSPLPSPQDQLRTALALGADRAIHVPLGASDADPAPSPAAVASILAAIVGKEAQAQAAPSLVLLGKQAIDDDASAVGPLLAAALGWPQATFASSIVLEEGGASVTVTREVDGGLRTVRAPLPIVVTADLRLNTPRFASLPAIMKAKKRPLESVGLEGLGADVATVLASPQVRTVRVDPPPPRPPGVVVASAAELVERLVKEGRLAT